MQIAVKSFEEIATEEIYKILQLRVAVFVVEQQCVYQDIDGKDQNALHVIGSWNDEVVAYTRVFAGGDYLEYPSIGRVVVHKDHRTFGYGKAIMNASIEAIKENFNTSNIQLSAQTYLRKFYHDLGFKEIGEEYLEDGIPHIMMEKNSLVL